jgi:hypothetical protein
MPAQEEICYLAVGSLGTTTPLGGRNHAAV